jgi:hypothetical protein
VPKRSDAFQTLVAQIQQHLGKTNDIAVEESGMLPNAATSELREVDIVVKGEINGVDVVISFECCNTSRKAGSPWVESMIGKHKRLPTHRLILVSGSGFTGPALDAIASEKNVEAATFEEASAVDWGEYSKNLTQLRFGGFEAAPKSLSVNWLRPKEDPDVEVTTNQGVVFRRITDGLQADWYQLSLAYLNDLRARRLITTKYYELSKNGKLKEEAGKETFTAIGNIDITVTWETQEIEWEMVTGDGSFPVIAITVNTDVSISDSPLNLSFQSFMGSNVAHGTVTSPFKKVGKGTPEEISVAVTKSGTEDPVASISFTSHVPDREKTYFAEFEHKEIE